MAEKKRKPAAKEAKAPKAAADPKATKAKKADAAVAERDARARSPKVAVVNGAGETIREIQLSPVVFGAKPSAHLVYEAVKQYRAGCRPTR